MEEKETTPEEKPENNGKLPSRKSSFIKTKSSSKMSETQREKKRLYNRIWRQKQNAEKAALQEQVSKLKEEKRELAAEIEALKVQLAQKEEGEAQQYAYQIIDNELTIIGWEWETLPFDGEH